MMVPTQTKYYHLTVADIMTVPVVTLADYEDMDLAGSIMSEGRIRHLPVVDDGGHLTGLVTHRDLLRVSVSDLSSADTERRRDVLRRVPVQRVMQRELRSVAPEMPLQRAARLLLEHKYGCLPVVDTGNKLGGIITEADFVALTVKLLALSADDE